MELNEKQSKASRVRLLAFAWTCGTMGRVLRGSSRLQGPGVKGFFLPRSVVLASESAGLTECIWGLRLAPERSQASKELGMLSVASRFRSSQEALTSVYFNSRALLLCAILWMTLDVAHLYDYTDYTH